MMSFEKMSMVSEIKVVKSKDCCVPKRRREEKQGKDSPGGIPFIEENKQSGQKELRTTCRRRKMLVAVTTREFPTPTVDTEGARWPVP
jgi:hypothetical protein